MSRTKKVPVSWTVTLSDNETVLDAIRHIRDEEGYSVRNIKATSVMGNVVTLEGFKRVRGKR